MDVAQRPIIKTGRGEFIYRGRSIIGMPNLATDVRMKYGDVVRRVATRFERSGEIFHHSLSRIADAGYTGDLTAPPDEWFCIGSSAEGSDIRWKLEFTTPAVQRVMVS